ncbi:ABC-three component system protein [Paenibacillus xylanexedens]|uniref:ABC-three component system protein n=1 Tax=Paenibacillus xylanexedens TaxID=528191 RepID=UPI003CFD4D8A
MNTKMWHNQKDVMASVCRLTCGHNEDDSDKGTAFLVAPNMVITATHNVKRYLEDKVANSIKLEFLNINNERIIRKAIPRKTNEGAIIFLELDSPVYSSYLRFSNFEVDPGIDFETFGYPTVKWSAGQWVKNKVSRVMGDMVYNPYDWNIDLSHQSQIADFSGLSGAPLLVDGKLVGVMLTEAMENGRAISLGAIGLSNFKREMEILDIQVHEYVDPYLHSLNENQYKDFIFVEKLEAASIFEHDLCQTEFYHAEILSESVNSKEVKSEMQELSRLKSDVRSFWYSKYLGYKDEDNGGALLSSVYDQIEKCAETTLASKIIQTSLYAKKGLLHQWADNCKIGWVKNYERNLIKYREEKEGTSNGEDS